jgi:hypothetical protein
MFIGSRRSRGQTIVIFALALTALIGMVGLVIDGGNAFAQQRKTQNGADAAAEAGATELARRAIGVPGTDAQWDARVWQAIQSSITYNDVVLNGIPQYTDFDGNPVGNINTGTIPAAARGVFVLANRDFPTYLTGIFGMTHLTATAPATARTGYLSTFSPAGLLPVTFPVLLEQCIPGSGSNGLVLPTYGSPPSHAWPTGPNNVVALPFCANGPGNVGWIDWTPPAGGASELAGQITNPNGPSIHVNHWYYITQTGDITSVDSAMDTWEGRDIYIPIYYVEVGSGSPPVPTLIGTCDTTPSDLGDVHSCPAGHLGGNGSNQWYYITAFASFHLLHSYIAQNHQAECNDTSTLVSVATFSGNPENNCLIGYFNDAVIVGGGEVQLNAPNSEFHSFGVQLIK